jgi:1,4-dihydroxy-2-naphthoyl-CoA hydrolase
VSTPLPSEPDPDQSSSDEVVDLPALLARLDAGETLDGAAFAAFVEPERDAFASGVIGLVYDTIAHDRVTAHAEVGARHQQPYGIINGGVWCTIVESIASVAGALRVASSGKLVVGVSNTTDFLRSSRGGRVDAEATVIHAGRQQQLWQVVITRPDDGKALARGQVRLQVVEAGQLAAADGAKDTP